MTFTLPPLPFDPAALEPHMSARTLSFHHGKHHLAYVTKANELIAGTRYETMEPIDVVRGARAEGNQKLFNQAGQAWNHSFLWNSLSPNGGGAPTGELAAALERDLGGVEKFGEAFTAESVGHFASGWAWLVADQGALKVISTHDADSAIAHEGLTPLLVLDLWEHAYYLDYQNARPAFVGTYLKSLINWDFAAQNFAAAG
jgi:Fe-Mn family superoxide dismutase